MGQLHCVCVNAAKVCRTWLSQSCLDRVINLTLRFLKRRAVELRNLFFSFNCLSPIWFYPQRMQPYFLMPRLLVNKPSLSFMLTADGLAGRAVAVVIQGLPSQEGCPAQMNE